MSFSLFQTKMFPRYHSRTVEVSHTNVWWAASKRQISWTLFLTMPGAKETKLKWPKCWRNTRKANFTDELQRLSQETPLLRRLVEVPNGKKLSSIKKVQVEFKIRDNRFHIIIYYFRFRGEIILPCLRFRRSGALVKLIDRNEVRVMQLHHCLRWQRICWRSRSLE